MMAEVAAAPRLFTREEYHRMGEDVTRIAGPAATVALQAFPDVALALTEIFA
jgi:hypothetical protein